ncbi:hypothetical protein PAESOLCIP111_01863 [Paenibacillus solanacearum]|uniref:Uncharacterized protein n=1 Tax=Paenibacillus solanacearum TaxID=2048548 RepID=A0A916NID8_9BACL|nr:hypothetical protein PAESOLCIP111_01863 [Paenibacillus solanacearum]
MLSHRSVRKKRIKRSESLLYVFFIGVMGVSRSLLWHIPTLYTDSLKKRKPEVKMTSLFR